MTKRISFGLALAFVFIAVLIPSLHVPMQSDDFAYYSLGLSLDAQIVHYMGWSGRIVTNFISSYLLNVLPHFAYETVNAAVFTLLVLFVSIMPSSLGVEKSKTSSLALLIIFSLYWIANPALGETSFWIVGSTNYLWTSMFVCGYFVFIFRMLSRCCGPKESFYATILGFLAGCSNENTSVVVVLITIFIVLAEKNKRASLYGLAGSIVGAAVLILSPGNKSRSNSFVEWKSLSFVEKFDLHFYDRFPAIMSTYWQVYLVFVISILAVLFISKPNKKQLLYAMVFFVGAVLANAAFLASPYVPARAGNGALVLMLVSLSFVVSGLLESAEKLKKLIYVVTVSCFILIYFVPSYYLFSSAVSNVWAQNKIKESMIFDAKSNGLKHVEVPNYYFTKLLKPSDSLASFDNSAINLYYGVEDIKYFPVGFNYANIEKNPKIDVDLQVANGVTMNSIYAYDEGVFGKSKLLFKVSGDINSYFASGAAMYVHVFMRDGTYVNRDTASPTIRIDGAAYTFAELGVDYRQIDRIELGIYKSTQMLSSFVIKDPEFSVSD
ncbi:DUF3329 domain-containing protein [Pseudomonas paracarnis]|uniref:DUF6056 family protein n=1 Tax=Pseudomonas paracarnis TaxID=2750625 RepID=A0ABU6BTW2_9PSED|nr:DUF6056 family protein [Pseudomonas paracarnis]MBW9244078.1 hypothetical protein [Pseudomonas paracarnis]MEB3783759.1 DUF6056 family protein [Pseudomonas paracarnis]